MKDTVCTVWSKPVTINGIPSTGEQALQDIYNGCAKTACELLGDSILVPNTDGELLGKCVVMAHSRLDDIYGELCATYGQYYADGTMDTVFGGCWRNK